MADALEDVDDRKGEKKARPETDELWAMCELKCRPGKMTSEVSWPRKQDLGLSLSDVMIRNTKRSP